MNTTAIVCGDGQWTRPDRPAKFCCEFQPIAGLTADEMKRATCSHCQQFTNRKVKEVKGG